MKEDSGYKGPERSAPMCLVWALCESTYVDINKTTDMILVLVWIEFHDILTYSWSLNPLQLHIYLGKSQEIQHSASPSLWPQLSSVLGNFGVTIFNSASPDLCCIGWGQLGTLFTCCGTVKSQILFEIQRQCSLTASCCLLAVIGSTKANLT